MESNAVLICQAIQLPITVGAASLTFLSDTLQSDVKHKPQITELLYCFEMCDKIYNLAKFEVLDFSFFMNI